MPILKDRLASGEKVVGPFVILNSPDLIELIGHAGWDFVVIDCEHGPFGNEAVANLARACLASGMHPVVRVPSNEEWLINKALDVGAEAVLIPQIDSLESARRAVAAAKYVPRGRRGANPFTRAAAFGAAGAGYYERANRETVAMLLVEGASGADAFEEMVRIEDADAFFIGPVDLSHSLGVPGQPDHPRVLARIEEMVAIAGKHHKAVGVFANDLNRARSWMASGVQFVAFSVDTAVIYKAFHSLAEQLKEGI